jgi:hypothetical protein
MAAPATHIILAKIIKEKYFPKIDDRSYFIGTSFADIRYIASVDRNSTHFYDINHPTNITDSTPFMIGLKVHSFVDEKRHKFMTDHGLYDIIKNDKLSNQIMKVYEDIYLYDEISDWSIFANYFNDLISDEKEFNIPTETLERWHRIIKFCISQKPDEEMAVKFLGSKLQEENDQEIKDLLNKLRKDVKVQKLIADFYQDFKESI